MRFSAVLTVGLLDPPATEQTGTSCVPQGVIVVMGRGSPTVRGGWPVGLRPPRRGGMRRRLVGSATGDCRPRGRLLQDSTFVKLP